VNLYYLDSSALVKRYYREDGTEFIQRLFDVGSLFVTSSLALVEVVATLARKRKAGAISQRVFEQKVEDFQEDWQNFVEVRLTPDVIDQAKEIAKVQALKGADALHLASALKVKEGISDRAVSIFFVASDKELKQAARKEGFTVIDPEETGCK